MRPWKDFFPFDAGTILYIDGPGGYNGTGTVEVNNGNNLRVKIAMPAYGWIWVHVPASESLFAIEAKQEGPGNYGHAEVRKGGEVFRIDDNNVDIMTDERSGKRRVDFSRAFRGKNLAVTAKKLNELKSRLIIEEEGRELVFDVLRTVK